MFVLLQSGGMEIILVQEQRACESEEDISEFLGVSLLILGFSWRGWDFIYVHHPEYGWVWFDNLKPPQASRFRHFYYFIFSVQINELCGTGIIFNELPEYGRVCTWHQMASPHASRVIPSRSSLTEETKYLANRLGQSNPLRCLMY